MSDYWSGPERFFKKTSQTLRRNQEVNGLHSTYHILNRSPQSKFKNSRLRVYYKWPAKEGKWEPVCDFQLISIIFVGYWVGLHF